MSVSDLSPRLPLWQRLFFAVPVIGWIARDLLFGDKDNIWYALIGFVSLWAAAALTFGLPGLYLPALALVPIIWICLIFIAWG
jgi:hypothetical protein